MSEEIKTRDSLKAAFSTGQKPTQSDFADVFNSFVHKDDKVDVTSTTGIYSIEETDRLLSSVIVGEGNAAQFMQSIEAISNAATAAQERADEAYTLAEHADGPESTGYAWANTAHTRCQDIENNVEQLSGQIGSALALSNEARTMAQQNATTGQYGRVQLASNTGTSSDSGKVPVIGSNGKLNANVIPSGNSTRFNYTATYKLNSSTNKYEAFVVIENAASATFAAVLDVLARGEKGILSGQTTLYQSQTLHKTIEVYNNCLDNGPMANRQSGCKINGILTSDMSIEGSNIKIKAGEFVTLDGNELGSQIGGVSVRVINEI